MTKKQILKRLENKGYSVTFDLCGLIIATGIKHGYHVKYKADTLNGLNNLIS